MSYHNYKTKLARTVAAVMVSMALAGVCTPVVFAEEVLNPPKVVNIFPESRNESHWFNEETLRHDIWDTQTRNRLFLKVSFHIEEGELSFAGLDRLMNNITVFSDSSNISMIDMEFLNNIANMETDSENPEKDKRQNFIDKYIFVKSTAKNRATLYIPIKPLMSHMTYSVTLGQGIVYTDKGRGNDALTWNFNTMAIPSVAEKDVEVQSVIEDYNVSEPIIITGKFFYSPTVEVYFNDVRAYRVRVNEDDEGEEYLEVYLPRGRNKLDPGLYDITVENSYNHSKWLYGTLSVVSEAEGSMPVEDNSFGTTTTYGIVSGARRAEIIRLNHSEPVREQALRKQLSQYNLKSPIVEVHSISYNVQTFHIEIPIEQGEYRNYKVLKYDELSRIWTEERHYDINKTDQRGIITSLSPGTFVVVEPKK